MVKCLKVIWIVGCCWLDIDWGFVIFKLVVIRSYGKIEEDNIILDMEFFDLVNNDLSVSNFLLKKKVKEGYN